MADHNGFIKVRQYKYPCIYCEKTNQVCCEATVGRSEKCEVCRVRKRPCEFLNKKRLSAGPKVWCNPELKAFGYENPLVKETTTTSPTDDSSKGKKNFMRLSGIPAEEVVICKDSWIDHEVIAMDSPTGSQSKRRFATSTDDPTLESSSWAHIKKAKVLDQALRAKDQAASRKSIENTEGSPPIQKLTSQLSPTPLTKQQYNHPTCLGEFISNNPHGPMTNVGTSSQESSLKLPGPFVFEDELPQWPQTTQPLPNRFFECEKATARGQIFHAHKACGVTVDKMVNLMSTDAARQAGRCLAQKLEETLKKDLGSVDCWLKKLELDDTKTSDWSKTKGKGRAE